MSDGRPDQIALRLRALTPARVGLGRTGVSQQAREVLAFQQAHAMARDAVHAALNARVLAGAIASAFPKCEVLRLHSGAPDRATYLQRPDLGRTLDAESRMLLKGRTGATDIALVIADGLSALAVERHALPVLEALLPRLAGWKISPIAIVEQGRVAIGDTIGAEMCAEIALVLIGERPGLSSPDSLGAYVTWMPRAGRTDAERVCISNIRAEGLSYAQAAAQIEKTLRMARQRRMTGVGLEWGSPALPEESRKERGQ